MITFRFLCHCRPLEGDLAQPTPHCLLAWSSPQLDKDFCWQCRVVGKKTSFLASAVKRGYCAAGNPGAARVSRLRGSKEPCRGAFSSRPPPRHLRNGLREAPTLCPKKTAALVAASLWIGLRGSPSLSVKRRRGRKGRHRRIQNRKQRVRVRVSEIEDTLNYR